ncbi:MAG: hypothetical protein ACREBI_10875 [Nitrosotalea sp.]
MYNNIFRKITSLSLLTILLLSSAAFALPNTMPSAHAQVASHPNLFVSAENSQFNNYFAGPQVVQVIVNDPNINRLDQAYGEPIVTVNGKRLRMAQGTDGNWYGYFADRNQAEIASNTAPVHHQGLNFGAFCGTGSINGIDFGSQSKGFTVAQGAATGSVGFAGASTTKIPVGALGGACGAMTTASFNGTVQTNVVRENKTLNTNPSGYHALPALVAAWPVIQLYDFSAIPTPVVVDYSAAGGDQIVNLTFDRIPSNLITVTPDRTAYSTNTQVFLTMNDPQLNIDPTEEDSWTWGSSASNNTLYYEAFDRNGVPAADSKAAAMQNLVGNLTSMMFNHNGKFTLNPSGTGARVVDFQSNGKQILNGSSITRGDPAKQTLNSTIITAGSQPITFIEQGGVNTGVFGNWDGAKKTDVITLNSASIRGQSATFKYNDIGGSIVGGFAFGSITMTATNNTWASGQRIPITLTDMDANKNSKVTEHLNFYDRNVERVTAMKIGHPFTLAGLSPESATMFLTAPTITVTANGTRTLSFSGTNATDPNVAVDESFSGRPIFTWQSLSPITIANGGGFTVDTNSKMSSLLQTIHNTNSSVGDTPVAATSRFHGFNFLNYDLRSFTSLNGATGSDPTAVQLFLIYNTATTVINPSTGLNSVGDKAISLANSTNLQDFINLNSTLLDKRVFSVPASADVGIMFQFTTAGTTLPSTQSAGGQFQSIGTPVATDFFSIGIIGDGTDNSQRINNAIYRWELEETGDNTGVFTGTTQYLMLNQLNLLDPATYTQLRTISHDVLFVAIQDMLQSEARAPQATYLDLGADGVNTQISAQQDIPTHSGTVSFDQKTYKVGDTVTITVNDPDLNTNNDLVVIYNTVAPTGAATEDPAVDTVGVTGLGTYSDGRSIGRLLDVQFGQKDLRWTDSTVAGVNPTSGACFGGLNGATREAFNTGLANTGFSLVETAAGSGVFTGTFEVPDQVCQGGVPVGVNGQNIKVNYVDFRDESGKLVEVSDNAGIRGNTGSVKLDKTVYPVPFGTISSSSRGANFDTTNTAGVASASSLQGVFPLHRDLSGNGLVPSTGGLADIPLVLPAGNVIVHARVNDPDYVLAASGTNTIATGVWYSNGTSTGDINNGPVAFQVSRQGQSVLLATAGGPVSHPGHIVDLLGAALPPQNDSAFAAAPDLGPMVEISPGSGIFQTNLPIELTDGPAGTGSTPCLAVTNYDGGINGGTFAPGSSTRFALPPPGSSAQTASSLFSSGASLAKNYCVRQGDVLTVTYFDTSDASGQPQTVTDSATFDLRNGVLQSDKSVYIIGSDMILTLVEPDFNLDSQTAETLPLDLVEWDSHAYKGTMGPLADKSTTQSIFASFDAKPSTFVETGKDTGIFQAVIKIPQKLGNTLLERGEQINLEYTDWGPAGSKTVGANSQDIELTIYTSNFGATVQLDQKVYTWTDRVYMTVVAPDHNFDPNLIDTIGLTSEDQVIVSTRGHQIYYKLSETGVDTGIFTGYVILTGDNTIKGVGGVDGQNTQPSSVTGNGQPNSCQSVSSSCGPTDGFLQAEDSDGVSVSFEFTRDQTVTGSALIRWNIGEVSWLQASYPANGQGVLQIVDPDMNLNPKAVDKFDTNVWSDSDSGGIKLTMTETGQDTGIFQGTVYFTTNFQSSGNRLHVSQGDTVTGEYDDRTLPPPYTSADDLRMTSTTFIGTVVPPLERAPATNPRIVDSFGNAINGTVKTGQQIQVTADLANGQNTDQPFAYLVQIQDSNGVTVSLSWITGTLSAGQSLNPAQSWTPSVAGTYTAQIFVWQSINNPNALSPPLSTTITVQ